MRIHHEFSKESITYFNNQFGDCLILNEEQMRILNQFNKVNLLPKQMNTILETIAPSSQQKVRFIEDKQSEIVPISMSLFQTNTELWEIMKRKQLHPDRIYPMITVPWFFWDSEAMNKQNPFGVVQHDMNELNISIIDDMSSLSLSGKAGNFCGLVSSEVGGHRIKLRPIVLPNLPDKEIIIPSYEFTRFTLRIRRQSAIIEIYPTPIKEYDYSFSESPKVFYNHGVAIKIDGGDVYLRIGNRESQLRGDVTIFFGWNPDDNPEKAVLAHVWLWALFSLLSDKTNT